MRSLKERIGRLEGIRRPKLERLAVIGHPSRSDLSLAELVKGTKVVAVHFVGACEGRPIEEAEDAWH